MTDNLHLTSAHIPLVLPTITTADGSAMTVSHVGSISTLNLSISDVFYVPKQPALSFNNSESIASVTFDLIHSDVWELSPVPTMGGSRYFIIFVDDFSCYTWIYLMKNRSDVLTIYRDFAKMIQTQYSKAIKVFRSNNVQEYRQTTILKHYGTIFHTSCADTSQKNGRVEHKLRHILDIVRALTNVVSTLVSF